ncbi:phage tail tube protein [Nonomuraea recticatena]|uniref:Phage tail protein n=1 Tax=Nonomuraea recticatena TaxID=46178 RepID=A0ABP6EHF0_9ACTN
MSANNSGAIRFASNGTIWVAPVDTAAPTDVATAPSDTWKALGYVDTNGVELTPSIETQPVEAWQSGVPIKYLVTSAAFQLKFTLHQFDKESVELYFGSSFRQATGAGGTPVTGVFQLDLSSTPALAETAMIVEWKDATVTNRLIVPRASVSARDGLKLVRNDNNKLGVTLNALDSGGRLGYILTNATIELPTPPTP